MHDSAYRIGELVMRTYSDLPNAKILEVGSLNVNGCLRDAATSTTHYVGLDLEAGPSVDFVITPGHDFPIEDDSFDLVIASSVFEHDPRFWDTFVRMCRAARAGGHIYVNAPSNGNVHRYPMDCWRFYPDAGLALVEHARSEGLEIDLVESFIGNRHSDVWNDFVAIFRKGPSADPLNTTFVYHRYPSLNARTWQSRAVYNESGSTEDMTLIDGLRRELESLSAQGPNYGSEMQRFTEMEQHNSRITVDNEYLVGQVATLESNLRQRQEEIEQAWARTDELATERDALKLRIDELQVAQERLETRLVESDGWVFKLSGERRSLEDRLAAVQSELERARRSITGMNVLSDHKQQLLLKHREDLKVLLEQKVALHHEVEMLVERLEERERATRDMASLRSDALEYHAKAAKALEQLDIMRAENKQQARALRALEAQAAQKERELGWTRRVYQLLEKSASGWKGVLPPRMRRQRLARMLERKGLFDGDAYLAKYTDVAEAGVDPLRHYILHGMAEGRFTGSQA
jgi:SAM-dependent methyltransferase